MEEEPFVLRASDWLLQTAAKLPLEAGRKLARFVGGVWYRADDRHRKIALRNLELAFGSELDEARRRTICRESFNHLAQVMIELPYLSRLTSDGVDRLATFSGMEHLASAVAKGKGILLVTSHFGNWELMALAFSLRYHPTHFVVRPLDNPHLDRIVSKIRSRGGNQQIPKKGSVRQVLRLLSRGQTVAILMDQNVDWYDGVFVPFFGEIACTNKAVALLALRTGACVVPVYNFRQPDGRYRLICGPEAPITRTGDRTRDIEENTALLNSIIEGYVREHPEQWLWVHQRWKTRPYKPWPRTSMGKNKPK